MSQDAIIKDLDSLIKSAAEIKTAGLKKQASPADPLDKDNGTQAVTTGAHYDKNVTEAGKHTAAKVDGGAEANKPGASLEASTEGATAVSTDGQSGANGADLDVKKDAANGSVPASELSKTSAALDDCAGKWLEHAKGVSAGLSKAAAELPVDDQAAAAMNKLAGILGKSDSQAKLAAKDLTGFDRFLAKKAQDAGLGGGDEVGQAQAGAGDLMQRLQAGQVSEEEAAKILTEAAQSGALSEQDLQELQQLAQAQGGAGGDPAAAAAAGAPPVDPAAAGGAPPAGPMPGADGQIQDPGLEAKVAALHIGPDHPDYIKKLASFHGPAVQFGYDLAIKTAQEVLSLEEAMEQEKGEGDDAGKPQHSEEGEGHKEPDADDKGDGGGAVQPEAAKVVDGMTGAGAPPDQAAAGLPPMPPAAPGAGAPPMAGGDPAAATGGIPTPKTPEEAAALQQLLQELGMTPQDLAQLQQAQPKVAAEDQFKLQARQAILGKVAALRITANTKKAN